MSAIYARSPSCSDRHLNGRFRLHVRHRSYRSSCGSRGLARGTARACQTCSRNDGDGGTTILSAASASGRQQRSLRRSHLSLREDASRASRRGSENGGSALYANRSCRPCFSRLRCRLPFCRCRQFQGPCGGGQSSSFGLALRMIFERGTSVLNSLPIDQ